VLVHLSKEKFSSGGSKGFLIVINNTFETKEDYK